MVNRLPVNLMVGDGYRRKIAAFTCRVDSWNFRPSLAAP
jgi:hypothetical protein